MEKILQTLKHRALSMLTKTSMRIVLSMTKIQKFSPLLLFQMKKVCILIAILPLSPSFPLSSNCMYGCYSNLKLELDMLLRLFTRQLACSNVLDSPGYKFDVSRSSYSPFFFSTVALTCYSIFPWYSYGLVCHEI